MGLLDSWPARIACSLLLARSLADRQEIVGGSLPGSQLLMPTHTVPAIEQHVDTILIDGGNRAGRAMPARSMEGFNISTNGNLLKESP